MSNGRHSYVAFYPSDWIAGTARMTPMQELVYFRVCLYNWDKGDAVPAAELPLMLGTVPDWRVVLLDLVHAKKLIESPDGSVANTRAVSAAREAHELWEKKSRGGRTGAARTNAKTPKAATPAATPAKSADETPAATHDSTPAASDDGTRPGLPPHNQNHNQNQQNAVLDTREPFEKFPESTDREKREVRAICEAFNAEQAKHFGDRAPLPHPTNFASALRMVHAGATADLVQPIIASTVAKIAQSGKQPLKALSYFIDPVADALAQSRAPMPAGVTDAELVASLPAHLDARRKRPANSFDAAVAAARSLVVGG